MIAFAGKRIFVFCICFFIISHAFSQEKKLEYQIKRNGDVVGKIQFIQQSTGSRIIGVGSCSVLQFILQQIRRSCSPGGGWWNGIGNISAGYCLRGYLWQKEKKLNDNI